MKTEEFKESLKLLNESARKEILEDDSKIVFMSDFHMGDGSSYDDFLPNKQLVQDALRRFYYPGGWKLVLNGDIEELHKYSLGAIRKAYPELYGIFGEFQSQGRLRKLVGNHDHALHTLQHGEFELYDAIRFERGQDTLLVFHGHQSNNLYVKYLSISDFLVRFFVAPLKIRNRDKSVDSKRRFRAERRIYGASKDAGIVSVTGHTHRPLFESYSKYDTLRWTMETLLRQYAMAPEAEKKDIVTRIGIYSAEFKRLTRSEKKQKISQSLYEKEEMVLPCIFNSGCATGRGGFTAIEIEKGNISLVHWSKDGNSKPYLERQMASRYLLAGTPWCRYTLDSDSLEYVFAKVRMLR